MSDAALPPQVVITREALADGSMLARVRATLLPGMVVRSDGGRRSTRRWRRTTPPPMSGCSATVR
jgi:hypothetical protein